MGMLRLFLALTVCLNHIIHVPGSVAEIPFGPGSSLAVEIFFMISGFYMALILGEKYTGAKSLQHFFKNRFLRIYPAYFFVLVLIVLVSFWVRLERGHWVFLTEAVAMFSRSDWFTQFYATMANFLLLGQDSLFLLHHCPDTGGLSLWCASQGGALPPWMMLVMPQAWSIELEMLFYLICPLLVRLKTRTLALGVLGLLAIKMYVIGNVTDGDYWIIRFPPFELALFSLGIISYRFYKEYLKHAVTSKAMYSVVFFLFAFLIGCTWISGECVIMMAVYIIAFVSLPFVFRLSRESKVDRFIGDLSYPIYLVHQIVVQMVVYWYNGSYPVSVALCLTIVASILICQCIQRPIDSLRVYRRVAVKRYAVS